MTMYIKIKMNQNMLNGSQGKKANEVYPILCLSITTPIKTTLSIGPKHCLCNLMLISKCSCDYPRNFLKAS